MAAARVAGGARDWRRTLWVMVALYAAVAIGRAAAFPFLPLFYLELGVPTEAAAALWTGATISIQFGASALVAPLWGALADRVGRKAMVMRACIALSISTALVAFSTTPLEIFSLRGVAGIFGGFSSAAQALVASETPEDRLGYALGWLATAQLTGTLIGPLLGGILADHLDHNYRLVFVLTSIVTLIATLCCGALVHESGDAASRLARMRRRPSLVTSIREVFAHPTLAPMFVVILLAQVCALGVAPVVPLFVRSLVDPRWVATSAAAAMAATGIAGVIAAPLLGRLSDRVGSRRVVMLSILGAACFTLPQSLAGSLWAFVALRFGVGLFLGGILPAANAWVGRMFPADERGRIFGITASASFVGMAIGPILGSQIMAHFGFHAVFVTIGGLMLCNLMWLLTSVRDVPRVELA